MKRSKLLIVSGVLLLLLGLHAAARFPAIFTTAKASSAALSFSSGQVIGAALGALIWFFLAAVQWRGNGRWALGIGIFAIVTLLVQSGLFFLAVGSGRVEPSTADYLRFLFFTVLVFGTLAVVNLRLHATRKLKSA